MTIKLTDLKKAFAPFANLKKNVQNTLEIDIGAIAKALIDGSAAISESDDPEKALSDLEKRAELIDSILSKATEDDTGRVFVTVDSAFDVSEFSIEKQETREVVTDPVVEKDDEGVIGESNDTLDDINKALLDAKGWPSDMSPEKVPTLRSERLTKGEIPMSAREGVIKDVNKTYGESRRRVLGKRVMS